jgi:tetratricopeptide (TPR) repeat protein
VTKFQAIAAVATVLVVCALIGGVAGSIIIDAWNGDDSSNETPNAAVNSQDLLDELRSSAEANSENPEAQAALANYLANTGRFDEAVGYYEQAIQLAPENWVIRLDFAQALMNNEKLRDAIFQLDMIIDADPANAQAWYYRGQWLETTGDAADLDNAIFSYQQVIRYDPASFVAEQATARLTALGAQVPSASPMASPAATPEASP